MSEFRMRIATSVFGPAARTDALSPSLTRCLTLQEVKHVPVHRLCCVVSLQMLTDPCMMMSKSAERFHLGLCFSPCFRHGHFMASLLRTMDLGPSEGDRVTAMFARTGP